MDTRRCFCLSIETNMGRMLQVEATRENGVVALSPDEIELPVIRSTMRCIWRAPPDSLALSPCLSAILPGLWFCCTAPHSAPLAKLLVQRSRRENSKRNSRYGMSALHLSPGTKFMEDVASAMEYYAFQECTRPW